jgi:hypothetical protein
MIDDHFFPTLPAPLQQGDLILFPERYLPMRERRLVKVEKRRIQPVPLEKQQSDRVPLAK